jgi:predicted nucleotidyltransferase
MASQAEDEALLDFVLRALSPIDGVAAIVLGGSRGSRRHQPDSDYDIGIYYRAARPFDPNALEVAAAGLDDEKRPGLVTPFGGWGPWVDGGGWLKVRGHAVDLIYRDLERVDRIIDDARAGRYQRNYQQGHPAGFPSIIYAGEVANCRALWDPDNAIESRKRRLSPYPEPLRAALIQRSLDEARFSVLIGLKAAKRGDVAYVTGLSGGRLRNPGAVRVELPVVVEREGLGRAGGRLRRQTAEFPQPVGERPGSTWDFPG